MNSELDIHIAVCLYIKRLDDNILFSTNYASGLKLTARQASIQSKLQSSRGAPDLMVYEPRGEYVGLAIELKKDGVKLTKKNGLPASDHIKEQDEYLEALRERGWRCFFCVGYNDAIATIDEYLGIDTLKVEF